MAPKKKFVVLSTARSGTSALMVALGSHPEVIVHGEIFHEKIDWHIHPEFLAAHGISQRDSDPVAFVKEILAADLGRRVVGFKMWRTQSEPACSYVLDNPDVVKIILERKNRLAAMSSGMLARRTQVWNVRGLKPVEHDDQTPKMEFRARAFRRFIEVHDELFDYYRSHARGMTINVTYDDVANLQIREILDALELEGFQFQHQLQKLHPSDILSRFDSAMHESIRAELVRVGHPEWEFEELRQAS